MQYSSRGSTRASRSCPRARGGIGRCRTGGAAGIYGNNDSTVLIAFENCWGGLLYVTLSINRRHTPAAQRACVRGGCDAEPAAEPAEFAGHVRVRIQIAVRVLCEMLCSGSVGAQLFQYSGSELVGDTRPWHHYGGVVTGDVRDGHVDLQAGGGR